MKSNFEFRRKIFHLCLGIAIVSLLYLNVLNAFSLFIILVIGFFIALLSLYCRIPFISWFLDKFERKETFPGKGALTFFIGSLLAVKLFSFDIALASILILTFGDGVSHLVGRYYGMIKHPLNNMKLIEGTLVGLAAAFVSGLLFLSVAESFFASLVAMIVESIELKIGKHIIDDNITMPLVAGTVVLLMRMLF